MRVLVVSIPQAGHLTPMLPVIRALVRAGDDVTVATADDVRDDVAAAGAGFARSGGGMGAWFGALAARTRGVPGDGLPPSRIAHYFVPRLFGEVAAADMIDGVLAAAESFPPDLVMFDSSSFAGPLAAALLQVPAVHHTFGPLFDRDVLDLVADAVSPLWRTFGLDVPPYAGVYTGTTVTLCPPSLDTQLVPAGDVEPLRPAPPPERTPAPTDPPTVYATFGTMWSNETLLDTTVAALSELPVGAVLTTGQVEPALVRAAANVRVERFLPQGQLLPECSCVVHHGGAGTMFGALAHGLPQVVLPQAADNYANADRLEAAGVARVLKGTEVTADNLRNAVADVLEQPAFAEAARSLAAEIATMPTPDQVAGDLRGLA